MIGSAMEKAALATDDARFGRIAAVWVSAPLPADPDGAAVFFWTRINALLLPDLVGLHMLMQLFFNSDDGTMKWDDRWRKRNEYCRTMRSNFLSGVGGLVNSENYCLFSIESDLIQAKLSYVHWRKNAFQICSRISIDSCFQLHLRRNFLFGRTWGRGWSTWGVLARFLDLVQESSTNTHTHCVDWRPVF